MERVDANKFAGTELGALQKSRQKHRQVVVCFQTRSATVCMANHPNSEQTAFT
jgi:hypothetical protein